LLTGISAQCCASETELKRGKACVSLSAIIIMSAMVRHVPDAGSYAPISVLINERQDGVHLSYDRMASFLSMYGNAEALKVAQDLDREIEALLVAAAS
jgi:hypothetical protein